MCSPVQKVIIPKGLVQPDETTIVEIPRELHGEDAVVAMPKPCPSKKTMACPNKTYPRRKPRNVCGLVEQDAFQQRTVMNLEPPDSPREYLPRNDRTPEPKIPLHHYNPRNQITPNSERMFRPAGRCKKGPVFDITPPKGYNPDMAFIAQSTPQPIDYKEGSLYRDFRPKQMSSFPGCPDGEMGSMHRHQGSPSCYPSPSPRGKAMSAPATPDSPYCMPRPIGGSLPIGSPKPITPCPKAHETSYGNDCSSYDDYSGGYGNYGEYSSIPSEIPEKLLDFEIENPCSGGDMNYSLLDWSQPQDMFQPTAASSYYCDQGLQPPQGTPKNLNLKQFTPTPKSYYGNSADSSGECYDDSHNPLTSGHMSSYPSRMTGGSCEDSNLTSDDLSNSLGSMEACEQEQLMQDLMCLQEARRRLLMDTSMMASVPEVSQELSSGSY